MLLKELLKKDITETVHLLWQDALADDAIEVTAPRMKEHGDYASNVAMKLTKLVNKAPMDIATEVACILTKKEYVEKAEAVAPGFINIKFKEIFLLQELQRDEYVSPMKKHAGELIVLEYGSLNMGKPATIGHLLNMVHGEAMKRILRWYGFDVHAVDHVGDWGTQFGKLLYAMETWGDETKIKAHPIDELVKLYVHFHDEAEKDPTLEDKGREYAKRLEDGDPELKKKWRWMITMNMEENMKLYEELDVSFDSQKGESEYIPMIPHMVELLLEKGIAEKNEDGSVAVVFEKHNINLPSCLILKKDGSSLYHARDIATAHFRQEAFHPKKIIHVVAEEQNLYFRQLFAILNLLGWSKETEWIHMSYGLFSLKEGKISTRKGRVIYAEEVVKEGRERAMQILKERGVGKDPEIDIHELCETIALGSIFYANLSQNRSTSQIFDWNKALSFEGNSAPYLQYVYARASSVMRKAKDENASGGTWNSTLHLEDKEREVVLKILQFNEAVETSIPDLRSNFLAQYLYELSATFNAFYTQCAILHNDNMEVQAFRLYLVEKTREVMKKGLDLLNIKVPEKM